MAGFFSAQESAELINLARKGMDKGKFAQTGQKIWGSTGGRYGIQNYDSRTVRFGRMGYLNTIPQVSDKNAPYPEVDTLAPKYLTMEGLTYKAKYKYLLEDKLNDPAGFYKETAAGLGTAWSRTKELLYHNLFDRSTDATLTSGWDNLTLVNASHQLMNGATYSNVIAPTPISEALYDSINQYFDQIPDEHGFPTERVTKKTVIGSTTRERRHLQILNSGAAITTVAGVTLTAGTVNPNESIPSLINISSSLDFMSTPHFEDPNTLVVLGEGHELVWGDRWLKMNMFGTNDPPTENQAIWWEGYNGWVDARRILVITAAP
jgi:hypothetical protein